MSSASTPEIPDAARLLRVANHDVDIVAVGPPTHGEPALLAARNALVRTLVGHGVRSVAFETDAVRALTIDDAVRDGGPDTAPVPADRFGHTFGDVPANQDLVAWLRTHNASRPAADRVSFHGFDTPLELTTGPSPRRYLAELHGFLERGLGAAALPHRWTDLHRLLGDDDRWATPAAVLDAAASPGATGDAVALRAAADDLHTLLRAHTPALVAATSTEAWHRADLHARTARGLLRYHACAARPAPPAERISALLGVRYVVVAGSVGAGERLPAPPPDTATLDGCDAVLHASEPGTATPVGLEDLTARIAALPGVTVTIADEASGAPEAAWGNRFFFAGADRRMPFATIVDTDVPGWDELSRLDRPGVHRLNVQLGRREFERRFGFPPARLEELRDGFDFARFDVLLPHPLYGGQGWGCVLNPTPRSLPVIDELLRRAHGRASRRGSARKARSGGSP